MGETPLNLRYFVVAIQELLEIIYANKDYDRENYWTCSEYSGESTLFVMIIDHVQEGFHKWHCLMQ